MSDSFDELSFQEKYKINELTERKEGGCNEEDFQLLVKYCLALEEEADKAHTKNDELEDHIYELEEDNYNAATEFLEELVHNFYMQTHKDYTSIDEIVYKAEQILRSEEV